MQKKPLQIAIVGSGISGLAAAHALQGSENITLFEAGSYFGGHTHTVDITLPTAKGAFTHGIDTGFLVFNERTYPHLIKLLADLGVETAKSWLLGMVLSIVVFAWAMQLGSGDTTAFIVISALLAGVIADAGDRGRAEGAYFGWWNFATKLNLALAAGLTLPLLGLMGYTPGTQQPQALTALTIVYCLVPIAIKVVAALALYLLMIRTNQAKSVRIEPVETLRQAQGERG